jgi:hypothetical protein
MLGLFRPRPRLPTAADSLEKHGVAADVQARLAAYLEQAPVREVHHARAIRPSGRPGTALCARGASRRAWAARSASRSASTCISVPVCRCQRSGLPGRDRRPRGPCLNVALNDRPDYFGTAAARVQALSRGGDVVFTDAIRDDAEAWVQVAGRPLPTSRVVLKGIDGELRVHVLNL